SSAEPTALSWDATVQTCSCARPGYALKLGAGDLGARRTTPEIRPASADDGRTKKKQAAKSASTLAHHLVRSDSTDRSDLKRTGFDPPWSRAPGTPRAHP